MKRWMMALGVTAFSAAPASLAFVGCSTQNPNGGADATVLDVAYPDTHPADVIHPDLGQEPPPPYAVQVALAYCNRMKSCCAPYDGGRFDYDACLAQTKLTGWMGTNTELTTAVEQRMHVEIDMPSAQACVAGLAVLSCPIAGSPEITLLTDQCRKALVGKQTSGADCIASIECTTGYCETDGGRCSQAPEAGPLLPNDDPCTQGQQCASLLCVEPSNYACDAGPCTCRGAIDFLGSVCGLPPPPPPSDGGADASDAD